MKNFFIVVLIVGTSCFGQTQSVMHQLFQSMLRLEPSLRTEFAQKNIIPKLKILMAQEDLDLLNVFRSVDLNNLPTVVSHMISNYPPYIFAELEDLFKVPFLVSGNWSEGLSPLEFANIIKYAKSNSDISLRDHYSYLDRVIVKREGKVFKKETYSHSLPNPEIAMGIKFYAYFDDIIITLPEHTTLDQAKEFLVKLTLRPEGYETDTKRLPEFFDQRIEAARAGMSSFEYYCKYILKEDRIPKTDNLLLPKE